MMGTTMDNPACEWIRGRLPLWMGAGDDLHDPDDDGGDLGIEDRRTIDRHLAACPGCREHRSGWPVRWMCWPSPRARCRPCRMRRRCGPRWSGGSRPIRHAAIRATPGAGASRRGGPDLGDPRRRTAAAIGLDADTLREVAEAAGLGRASRSVGPGGPRSVRAVASRGRSWRIAGVEPGGIGPDAPGRRAGGMAAARRGRGEDARQRRAGGAAGRAAGPRRSRGGGPRPPAPEVERDSTPANWPRRSRSGPRRSRRRRPTPRAASPGRRPGSVTISSTGPPCRPTGATPSRCIKEG